MDSQKQDGIQKLLQAEQEANAIVTAARQGRFSFFSNASFSNTFLASFDFSLDCWMFLPKGEKHH